MCFKRNPTLGQYNGSRRDWIAAYRRARINGRKGREPNAALDSIRWKAQLIVRFERNGLDRLAIPIVGRLASKHLVDEILAEAIADASKIAAPY